MYGLGPPWSVQPSLKAMVEDVGIDFDTFLDGLKDGKTDQEIAVQAGVSLKVISQFREHFEKYGIDSIMGQD
jgi:hypothetical protein